MIIETSLIVQINLFLKITAKPHYSEEIFIKNTTHFRLKNYICEN